ncbi:beta strand repeat-containing protein, partial [Bradyrhizobium sacchari]
MAGPKMAREMTGYRPRSVTHHALATLLATTGLGVVAAHAADGTWTGGGTDWTNPTNWSSNPSVPNGTATFTNTGSANVDNLSGAVAIGTVQFTNNAQAYTVTIGNAFTVSGTGIINNSGNTQNFVSASGGINLVFQNSSTASGGTGAVTITTNNGATTSFSGSATGGSARFVTNAGGTVNISGLTNGGMASGSIEGGGDYLLGANTLATGSLNTSTQVDGAINSTGGGLTKVGTGTLTLTGINGYTGATTISAGTLALSGIGNIFSSSVVAVDATLDATAASAQTGITTLAGGPGGVVRMGSFGLFIANGSTEFAGSIQSTGFAGVEIGGGTQTLSGVNTYTNATQIDSGATLALKGNGSIANSLYVAFAGTGATLDISQTTSGTSLAQMTSFGTVGTVALGSTTLTITANSGTAFGGVIQDGGIGGGTGGNLLIANGGLQQLYGTNTYTGTTTIASGGELDLVNLAGSDGSIATSRNVIANGVFDIQNLSAGTSIKSLSGASTGRVNLGANMLTITNGNGNFAGVLDDAGSGGGLTLTGGMQTLSGNNTYTGATIINGGTLVVNGSILQSAAFVNAGGTLAGTGSLRVVTVNGGTLAPGTAGAVGTLSINGPLGFTAASTYLVQVSSTTASLANVIGGTA